MSSSSTPGGGGRRPAPRPPRTPHREPLDVDDYFDIISDNLDKFLFEPLYESKNKGALESQAVDQMADVSTIRRMNTKLKTIKTTSFIFSIVMLYAAWYNVVARNPIRTIGYGVLAADSFRVSYNCYIKNYCHIIAEKYSGDWKKLGKTIWNAAQSALGLADNSRDPLVRMQKDVMWEVLLDKSLVINIYDKVSVSGDVNRRKRRQR
jgi:hypothetical protein